MIYPFRPSRNSLPSKISAFVDAETAISKMRLVVTFAAGLYALAKRPLESRVVDNSIAALTREWQGMGSHTEVFRRPITKQEHLFLGDPSKAPVAVGDVVIRVDDLGDYIEYLAAK